MKKLLTAFLLLFFAAGCITVPHSYYVSPMDINANSYHNIPLTSDSISGASYFNAAFMIGRSNYQSRDGLLGLQASFHRSNNFGHFQAYYGLGLTAGIDPVGQYDGYYSSNYGIRDTVLRIAGSNESFAAYGFNGGLNYVISFRNGSEWRVLGIETSLQREFGNYLNFRKSLTDSVTNILATDNTIKTLGGYTELVWRNWKKTKEFGFRMSAGGSFVSSGSYNRDGSSSKPFYYSNTFHMTKRRVTTFIQFNGGNHIASFQTGVNVKLGKRF